MTTPIKKYDLRAHRSPVAGTITGLDGKDYEVQKFTGLQYQQAAQIGDATPATALYDLAAEVVPSMPREELNRLFKEDIQKILLCAGQGIEAIEALFPNESSPATPTSPG